MRLQPAAEHPHGLSDAEFDAIFTTDKPVIFAYHGYPWLIHRLTYRRTNHRNFHVRGYKEEGTTTTPSTWSMLNDLDRYHLVIDVIDRVPSLGPSARRGRGRTWSTRATRRGVTRASTASTCRRSPTGHGRGDERGYAWQLARYAARIVSRCESDRCLTASRTVTPEARPARGSSHA